MTVHTHRSRSQCNIKSRSPRASRLALANRPQNAKRPPDVGRDGRDDDDDDDDDDDATPNDANTPVVPSSTHPLVPSSSSSLDVRSTDRVDRPRRPTDRIALSSSNVRPTARDVASRPRVRSNHRTDGTRASVVDRWDETDRTRLKTRPPDRPTDRSRHLETSPVRPLVRSFGRVTRRPCDYRWGRARARRRVAVEARRRRARRRATTARRRWWITRARALWTMRGVRRPNASRRARRTYVLTIETFPRVSRRRDDG